MFHSLASFPPALVHRLEPFLAQTALEVNLPEGGLNVLHLALDAGLVVKSVIVVLLLASLWTWAIIFSKLIILRRRNAKCSAFEQTFWSGVDLEKLYDQVKDKPTSPFAALFLSAMREWQRVQVVRPDSRVLERIEQVTQLSIGRETDRLERQLGILASIGSTAPFVGLFGTVWGIMNSFAAIAAAANTSLAVVAPGIAEALFATALGLIAAIPATLGYNKISGDIQRFSNRMEDFALELSTILSRNLEGRGELR